MVREETFLPDAKIGVVTFKTKLIRRKRYGAADVTIRLFGSEISAVAVIAGKKKWASTEKDCIDFLITNGLSLKEARNLIADSRKEERPHAD